MTSQGSGLKDTIYHTNYWTDCHGVLYDPKIIVYNLLTVCIALLSHCPLSILKNGFPISMKSVVNVHRP